ncbi:ComEC/Rec2 family competence protein [Flavobacterium sp. DG1-102-2]|uniref:ComEC/Rec2 family competence protein n=1 Tax=Flavobacterium sp. DG1-102-2 TaxID=3081663 RepID=UPI0029490AA4|nr:ComEC/Rec2 family competence protein [Flavobacterium sp. DG1-102-2]MDV6168950.1 ComEC/Rec2 family competence protein [Flavobacterium sp. DG1-102-2]
MKVLKYPIAIITLFFAIGILIGYYAGISPFISGITTTIALASLAINYWQSKKVLLPKPYTDICIIVTAICIGMLTQSLHKADNSRLHYSNFINDNSVLTGVITERLKPNDYNERYYFEVTAINQQSVNGRVLLIQPKDSLSIIHYAGERFVIAATPLPIAKPLNPSQFDYAAYMQKQDVFHQLKLRNNFIRVGTDHSFDYYIGRLREKLINSFALHHFSLPVQNTINALLLGQRQDMDTETNNAYRDAGVLHILAISGLHFAVLFYVLTYLFKPLNRFKKKGKLTRLLLILSMLWGFAFITGLSASVVRSVVMFSFISIGQQLNRNTSVYNSLAVSMLVLLIAEPNFLFDAGFQLSYLAVFFIVWLQPFYKNLKASKYAAINYFSDTMLVSLAAQLGVLPLSLYYFNRFPLLFLAANLIVIPLSNVILLLGLFVLMLNFIWIDAALFFGKALGFLVNTMNGFIKWVASFESLVIKDISFTLLLTIVLYIVVTSFAFWLYNKNFKRTLVLLTSIIVFQGIYAVTSWHEGKSEEMIVFNNYRSTILTSKDKKSITVMSTDSLADKSLLIMSYAKAGFTEIIKTVPLKNVLLHSGKKIIVIDKDCVYSDKSRPDIIILTQSAKINLERLISDVQPKQIVADGTNYKGSLQSWNATCQKLKIPFHATAEKGFYAIQ